MEVVQFVPRTILMQQTGSEVLLSRSAGIIGCKMYFE